MSLEETKYKDNRALRVRARFVGVKDGLIVVRIDDRPQGLFFVSTVRDNDVDYFSETVSALFENARINLLDAQFDGNHIYASLIVAEPDFLIDISNIAECFKEYGAHPLNYFMTRLSVDDSTRFMLLGNFANQFLDDRINRVEGDISDFTASIKKAFATYPLSMASCTDIDNDRIRSEFLTDTKAQYRFIDKAVTDYFPKAGIKPENSLLEPTFICEALGMQGRLDLLHQDFNKFIELKSGKGTELFHKNEIQHKDNHYVQMLLYYAVLKYNLGIDQNDISAYLLYSRYPLMIPEVYDESLVKRAVNMRNLIVLFEYAIQQKNDPDYTKTVLEKINSQTLNTYNLSGKFWDMYCKPRIDQFANSITSLSELESNYFHSIFTFIAKEQYCSKTGDFEDEFNRGVTMLWNSTLDEKETAGEIIKDMKLISSEIEEDRHTLKFEIKFDENKISNFRDGDSVVLYKRSDEADGVCNSQVFKSTIEHIATDNIVLSLRVMQRNSSVLPLNAFYAIERDYMDVGFQTMFKGLGLFANINKDRRDLLLSQRDPQKSQEIDYGAIDNDIERIVAKADNSKDYFLLIGPPGTGKTSLALKRMVEKFYSDKEKNILLMAYTNKAVDEICHSLYSIDEGFPFIRVGQESSCDRIFRNNLLKTRMKGCANRDDVKTMISGTRVFVGTVSTLSRSNDLFKMKKFDVAIIDEASQIIEAQMLNILCMHHKANENAIGKFIFIGDHKQLPAVVVQKEEFSRVNSPILNAIGINDLRESLFERLYRYEQLQVRTDFYDILTKQGRMHPDIAEFPNRNFYNNVLQCVPLDHQKAKTTDLVNRQKVIEEMVSGDRKSVV